MQKTSALLLVVLTVSISAAEADAQDTTHSAALTAFTLGVPGVGGETLYPLFTAGLTVNVFRPNSVGPEFAVGTMPWLLANGLTVMGLRLGVAAPSVMSDRFILLPSAGVGVAVVSSDSDVGAVPSAYAGLATVIGGGRTSAFRAGVTWHRFANLERAIWLLELGVVRPFRR